MGFFGKVKVKDTRNAKEVLARVKKMKDKNARALVGLAQDATPYPDGTSVIMVGTVNEFGSGRIPERSFLRSTMDEKAKDYIAVGVGLLIKAIDGKTTITKALGLLGAQAQGDVQKKITDLKSPANAPLTIALKGSDNPLIDTGHMRSQITYEVKGVSRAD